MGRLCGGSAQERWIPCPTQGPNSPSSGSQRTCRATAPLQPSTVPLQGHNSPPHRATATLTLPPTAPPPAGPQLSPTEPQPPCTGPTTHPQQQQWLWDTQDPLLAAPPPHSVVLPQAAQSQCLLCHLSWDWPCLPWLHTRPCTFLEPWNCSCCHLGVVLLTGTTCCVRPGPSSGGSTDGPMVYAGRRHVVGPYPAWLTSVPLHQTGRHGSGTHGSCVEAR